MFTIRQSAAVATVCLTLLVLGLAQERGPGRPPLRRHTITQSAGTLRRIPASEQPQDPSRVSIELDGNWRMIRANGIPDHWTGPFPNRGNPNSMRPQQYDYRVPARPEIRPESTPLFMQSFGIAINGVPFDPGAAEWYLGNPQGGWQYEPLSGAIALGIDASYAHIQPTGAYHYHGLPTGLIESIGVSEKRHGALIGWAADGFPIYTGRGYSNPDDPLSEVKPLRSSYRLKPGRRPDGMDQPGGTYDGTFVADYEYVAGSGDLDECNGRVTSTPEFLDGTYAYFLTNNWPVIPRRYRGTPSQDFVRRGPPGGPPREPTR